MDTCHNCVGRFKGCMPHKVVCVSPLFISNDDDQNTLYSNDDDYDTVVSSGDVSIPNACGLQNPDVYLKIRLLLFPSCCLLMHPVKFPKLPLCSSDFIIRTSSDFIFRTMLMCNQQS